MYPVFTAVLFTIARTFKLPRYPLTDEQIKKLWCIYTMESYSDVKKNEFESVVRRWMNLETVTQSEVSQKEKTYIIQKCGYMESRKIVLMELFAGKEWRCRRGEWNCGYSEGRATQDELRK